MSRRAAAERSFQSMEKLALERISPLFGIAAPLLAGLLFSGCAAAREASEGSTAQPSANADPAMSDDGGPSPQELGAASSPAAALPGSLQALSDLSSRMSGSEVEGWVLLFGDAAFFSRPSEQAPLGQVAVWAPERRAAPDVHLMPARVIGESEGWIRVETLTSEEARLHCGGRGLPAFDRYRIRALVGRGELTPLVAESSWQRFPDGTGVGALAGVPIRGGEAGPILRMDDGRVEVLLPEVSVGDASSNSQESSLQGEVPLRAGLSYRQPGRAGEGGGGAEPLDMALADVDWRVNGEPVHVGHSGWYGVDVLAFGPHPDGESGTLATAAKKCWSLTMTTDHPGPAISPTHGVGGLGARSRPPSGRHWTVPEGIAAFWPDGADAGETLVEVVHHDFAGTVETEEGVSLSCFPLSGTIRICHRTEDAKQAGTADE